MRFYYSEYGKSIYTNWHISIYKSDPNTRSVEDFVRVYEGISLTGTKKHTTHVLTDLHQRLTQLLSSGFKIQLPLDSKIFFSYIISSELLHQQVILE